MNECVLITGGSGFLGTYIVRELLAYDVRDIRILMRGDSADDCLTRLKALWCERPDLTAELGRRIKVVPGDITLDNLGMDARTYDDLAREVTHIVHAAAEIGVNETAAQFATVNVTGTLNMLLFARKAAVLGRFERFTHVSTAYVAGTRNGLIREDELVDTEFNSLYEQSKFGAEQLVRDCAGSLPVSIVRPAQIVGDSETGFAATFNTLYYPLKLYLKGQLPVLPVSKNMRLNMVPVDFVARIVVRALRYPNALGKTYHATIPAKLQPTVGELLEYVREWAKLSLGFDPGVPRCVPVPRLDALGRTRNLAKSKAPKPKNLPQNMLALAPYFSENRSYETTNTAAIIDGEFPQWREFLPHLLAYATHKGFLNHTGRTVFEQMLVRLKSKRNTITYYDVSRDGIAKHEADDVREQIERLAASLVAHGIGAGDRVVLVGVNSVRYFIADAATGLIGATTVPLYYTSPVSDVVDLTRESGAKLAFIGTKSLLSALPEALDIPLVSLLEDAPVGVDSWGSFLDAGADTPVPEPAHDFDALATIRYSSGTTGRPKGVMFNQYQLRWMGEVMPSLLDWKTRNGKLRYLSFLPMSHVVEGILVAYAPYYILSDIEMYYLNDFDALVQTLPKVRPTLFFSVPRFYEKVWNQFEASSIGQRYLAMPEGPAKRALATVARTGLLRKAGLDQCRQLIVGSAPVSMELLENFRSLGIEIHNAYGVTEAPLIALSRLGENELGSVGALLPDTQARITDTGEIEIAGPQVAVGYDGRGACVNSDGYFETGDLGSYSDAGHLVIGGRQKELVITSYGKNVSPEKVETLLKGIPGVSEALLVGDNRPYVTALLWLEDEAREGFDATAFDAEVLRRNAELSHPEQVKRWAVMDQSLSIAAGELTPNLKLRRRNVTELNAAAIDALYGEDFAQMPGALHVGAQA